MTNFFKLLGIFTFIAILAFGGDWLYKNFPEAVNYTLKIIGILTIIITPIYLFLRLRYGKNWAFKTGLNFYFGEGLVSAIKTLIDDFRKGKVQTEKVAEVAAHVLWRFTRIGIFAVVIAIVPLLILLNQNQLLDKQNKLLDNQNQKVDIQNSLIEAERRSALIISMENVLKKVDEEILEQKRDLKENGEAITDSTYYRLSKALMFRISALSKAFRPYRIMEGDSLSSYLQSLERGQLFAALVGNNLKENTIRTILMSSDFSYSDLEGIDFSKIYLTSPDLNNSNLNKAKLNDIDFVSSNLKNVRLTNSEVKSSIFFAGDLSMVNFQDSDLTGSEFTMITMINANFSESDLINTRFQSVNLTGADFTNASLKGTRFYLSGMGGVKGLTIDSLKQAACIFKVYALDSLIRKELEEIKPCLFEDPDGPNACK